MASDLLEMTDQLGGAIDVFTGASMGGITGVMAQAGHDSELFRSLVLVDIAITTAPEGAERIMRFMMANPTVSPVSTRRPTRSPPICLTGSAGATRQAEEGAPRA